MSDYETPFRFLSPTIPLILVPVRINGNEPEDFILDTGNAAFPILLSEEYGGSLGLATSPLEETDQFTVDLSRSFRRARVHSFEVAGLRVAPLEAAIAPAIDELGARLRTRICGNVGYPFLKDYAMTLSFQRSTLTLSTRETSGSYVPIEVDPEAPLVMVDVTANGHRLNFALDTGASLCCISVDAAEELELGRGRDMSLNRTGASNGHVSSLRHLSAGTHIRSNVQVAVAHFLGDLSEKVGRRVDGVLGHNFWSHYALTIDYPRKRLILAEEQ